MEGGGESALFDSAASFVCLFVPLPNAATQNMDQRAAAAALQVPVNIQLKDRERRRTWGRG